MCRRSAWARRPCHVRYNRRVKRGTVAILAILAIAIALARLVFLHDLPEWDQSTYFLIGDAMHHGQHLYADIWDMKPPGIFATYAFANLLTNSSFEWTVYLLSVLSAIGTMIAVYFAGAKWSRSAGLHAATCYAIVSMQPALGGTIANLDSSQRYDARRDSGRLCVCDRDDLQASRARAGHRSRGSRNLRS
jgi:4-amino-4-deoxy-L-arabinose transferase-like glycosyltransferase